MRIIQLLVQKDQVPLMVDSYLFSQIMVELGCAKKSDLENDMNTEFKKLKKYGCIYTFVRKKEGFRGKMYLHRT